MQPEPTVLAYLAGVIDSDGYITVGRSTHKGRLYHCAKVGIAGTRRQPHDLAAGIWGGTVSRHEPKNPQHRVQYQWSRSGTIVTVIIEAIRPYLRVKAEQAFLALELEEHLIFGRSDDPYPWMPPDYDPIPYREDARREAIDLNQSRSRCRTFPGRDLDGSAGNEFPAELAVSA